MLRKTTLSLDEYEAIRLKDLLGMEQEDAAHAMGISQPTFHRILRCARKKVADALVNSRALHIEGGNVTMEEKRIFRCGECRHEWALPYGTGRPENAPTAGQRTYTDTRRINAIKARAKENAEKQCAGTAQSPDAMQQKAMTSKGIGFRLLFMHRSPIFLSILT